MGPRKKWLKYYMSKETLFNKMQLHSMIGLERGQCCQPNICNALQKYKCIGNNFSNYYIV